MTKNLNVIYGHQSTFVDRYNEQLLRFIHCGLIALEKNQTILDAGSYTGHAAQGLLNHWSDLQLQVTCLDVNFGPDKVDDSRIKFVCGDYSNLPKDIGKFDIILSANTLSYEHYEQEIFDSDQSIVDRLSSLIGALAPNGKLIIMTEFKDAPTLVISKDESGNLIPMDKSAYRKYLRGMYFEYDSGDVFFGNKKALEDFAIAQHICEVFNRIHSES